MKVSSHRAMAQGNVTDNHLLGEGHFDDGNKQGPSGTATPATPIESDAKGKKGRGKGSKRAKTAKQRLAIADGMIDA